ncbi:MAG: LysR family transcriptional regulator [Chloroflexi bacterium]|nr:LysR family transcriptional regulator [Chloroflexota bacterium]
MLNVHQLHVFLVAAETLNFTQTAKRLHLTQSSVSQHVKSLEGQLGVALFERQGRTLLLTPEGDVLLPMARQIVAGSMQAEETMRLLKREVHGRLVLACDAAPGKFLLPPLLAEFRRHYPLVRVACRNLPGEQAAAWLADGRADFALTQLTGREPRSAEFLLYRREPLMLAVPAGHRWAGRGEILPADLLEECFVLNEAGSRAYEELRQALQAAGVEIERLEVVLEMGSAEGVALAVEQGLGVGFVPQTILERLCPARLAGVAVRGLNMTEEVFLGRQTSLPAGGAQAAFWEFVRADVSARWQSDN